MANKSVNKGIKDHWSLVEFAKAHGKMSVSNTLTNSETGDDFKTCGFVHPETNKITLVSFSSKLKYNLKADNKELAKQIAKDKDELQVVELESGSFKLCRQGNFDSWEEVDLGI